MCEMLMSQVQSLRSELELHTGGLHGQGAICLTAPDDPPDSARTCFETRGFGVCLWPHI